MFATIGIALSVGGTSAALLALHRLRRPSCPACGAVGSVVPVSSSLEHLPGCHPTITRIRHCGSCGATVEEQAPHPPVARQPIASRFGSQRPR